MELLRCECGNEFFIKRHAFEEYSKEYYTHYIEMVCSKCGKPLPIKQHEVLGGF